MHRESDNADLETAALRIYADESGGDDPGTPHAVVGGMLISRKRFLEFEDQWDKLLLGHGVQPPLHMKEFGKDGRLGKMSRCCRKELIDEAVSLIRLYRVGSISISLSNAEFKKHFSKQIRDKFGVYGMCFTLFAMATDQAAKHNRYADRIPYILDDGNPYKHHVVAAHSNMLALQRAGHDFHVGSLTLDDDAVWGMLQAADIISWGARRRASALPLGRAFESINKLFTDSSHIEGNWEPEWLRQLGKLLSKNIEIENAKPEGQRFLPKV